MKKFFYIASFLLLIANTTWAQKTALDEIYLKNGSIIVGKLQSIHDDHYEITVAGGSLLSIKRSRIDSLKLNSRKDNWMSPSGKIYVIDQEGWFNRTNFGFTLGRSQSYYGSSGSTLFLTNITGYKINRYFQPGLALDAEASFDEISPYASISAHLEGEILTESVSPFYFGQLGYGTPMGAPGPNILEESGGMSGGLGIGLKFYGEQSTLWFVQLAYRFQRKHYTEQRWNGTIETDLRQNRVGFGLGFEF